MSVKFFCLPNLATDAVTAIENPWDVRVPQEILDLPKAEYKKRWMNPETKHWLLLLAQGQNEAFCVSAGNQAAVINGFMADYDGVFTNDIIDAAKAKPPSRYSPAWWSISQSGRLHLTWLFSRPITVAGNAHANALLHIIATKVRAVRWGVGYDTDSEKVTQVMDIGREWHRFSDAEVPFEEIVKWDYDLFKSSVRDMISEVVDIPFDKVASEIASRKWPHDPPAKIEPGVRCIRFWDPSADNQSAAQFTDKGIRVYTPHDGGFKSWKSLLGARFCEEWTARSLAPFLEFTTYCHSKDEYWRFFPNDTPPHYEKRTEKVLRRDLTAEAKVSSKPAKGEDMSEMDRTLYTITRRNVVDHVAPVLYRPSGRIQVRGLGSVLNTSLIVVKKPAARLASVTPEEAASVDCPQEYRDNPFICRWDNPFAVSGFPHIHRFLTAMFMKRQETYDAWARDGFPLRRDGRRERFLSDPQLVHLVSWMSHFYRNAARQAVTPSRGTVLILAGPAGTGKSFFGHELLGQLMGGVEYADKFYIDNVRFNDSMVKFPVHLIDDKLGSKSQRERLRFTEALKVVTANGTVRCEAKFGSSVEGLPWPGRIVILSNEDAQSLSVLPDLDMSTRDKFTMLKLGGARFGFGTPEENQMWLAEELPYFALFLLGWEIPADIRDTRFGVRAVQHNDMAQASAENGLTQVTLEVLETCIEQVTGTKDPDADEGYAVEGNAVKVFKWIQSVDPALGREVIDSRTLQQCLMILYKSGAYAIELDEATKRWRIPYTLRKKSADSTLTPSTEI